MSEADSDLDPEIQDLLSRTAEQSPEVQSPLQLRQQLEALLGIDLSDVEGDDAEQFADAFENEDWDEMREVLEDQGVDEQTIDSFLGILEDSVRDADAGGTDGQSHESAADVAEEKIDSQSANGQSADDAEYVTRDELEQMERQLASQIPSADEIASQIAGSGGGQAQQGGGGANTETQQMLAQALAQKFLQGGGGSSAMQQMSEKATERVMERSMQRLAEPSFGEKIGKAIEKNIAEQVGERYAGDIDFDDMGDGEEVESSDDDDDGKAWYEL